MQTATQTLDRPASSRTASPARSTLSADFVVDVTADGVTVTRAGGSQDITLVGDDIHIRWPASEASATLLFALSDSSATYESVSIKVGSESFARGGSVPVTLHCTLQGSRNLELRIDRQTWLKDQWPSWSVLFEVVKSGTSFLHDPRIYNDGPG